MTVVVTTGGRHYKNKEAVAKVLGAIKPTKIIVGDCPTGADYLVRAWNVEIIEKFRADWDEYGLAAGPIRNGLMIDFAASIVDENVIVISFPGNNGTRDCTKKAEKKGLLVLKVTQ